MDFFKIENEFVPKLILKNGRNFFQFKNDRNSENFENF